MSRIISYNTADKSHVIGFLGAAERFTQEQQRLAGIMRQSARTAQAEVDRQDLGWGLTVPDALEHLLAGHASSSAPAAGNAYAAAMQIIIDCNASDVMDWAVYSRPATFFSALDSELLRVGVSADLLPGSFIMGGLPAEFPFPLPLPEHAMENFGFWPLEKTRPAADAYQAVLDRVDEEFTHEVKQLIEKLEEEHENWVESQDIDWYTQDTIFFSITG
ncbi:hypothetical protein DT019_27385 [Streptomyces sp. SDr-06]|uniref:DUF7691 family protein n=1 Tax=Streptomyces sp. SDr-06 TaxID=2267702 RepID=UPI000DEB0DD5|nr:hypothetical protein [Streptomyces sp. SDr-06]RCH65514.1 hypothetical protein DT019_27385 [Streptomyces sp. SDr-06]